MPAAWKHQHHPSLGEASLEEVISNITYIEAGQNFSTETLRQILLSVSEDAALRHIGRPWLAYEVSEDRTKIIDGWLRKPERVPALLLNAGQTTQGANAEMERAPAKRGLTAHLISQQSPAMQP